MQTKTISIRITTTRPTIQGVPRIWDAEAETPVGTLRGDGYSRAEALGNLIEQSPASFGVILHDDRPRRG